MAANNIEVNSNAITSDARELEQLEKQAEKMLKTIYGLVGELDAMWDGPANEAFKNKFVTDYQSFTDILKFVQDFSQKMNEASTKYSKCENDVLTLVSSLKI